ncbi:MAG TPA: hypothetical protein VHN15_09175 [Thermoanaerobaculia bacterium]|nr:hypothetical protein [Thermoanaerobaculia bacterium]
MAEPRAFSALPSPPGRLHNSRVATPLPRSRRPGLGLEETFELGPRRPGPSPRAQATEPRAVPAQVETDTEAAPAPVRQEVEDPSARLRAAEHASAERTLRGALLVSLLLNLVVFLGVGFSLPLGPITRADALLAAVTLVAAVGLLALGEICRKGDPPSRS